MERAVMVNPKSRTVVTLPRPKLLNTPGGNAEQPKEFRFAVTWETLLAQPQPAPITEIIPTAVVVAPREIPARSLQVVEPPLRPRTDDAAWEMVVPKMERR
jgi:hypothetical protein